MLKRVLLNLAKVLVVCLALALGTLGGGMLAVLARVPAPAPPAGMDARSALTYLLLTTPLIALALAAIATGLGGNIPARTLTLAFLMWIAYTVNTQLEASVVSVYASGFWYSVLSSVVPALMAGGATALLFPCEHPGGGMLQALNDFFKLRTVTAWACRLPLAAVAFMAIYFVFGLIVLPFTEEYYRQSMFGLVMPTLDRILPVLFLRSVLFFTACLPILVMWQKSDRSLFWRLGFALFVLVGLVYMLIATWLPVQVRGPHSLEIFADEFVYAGVLVLLLGKRHSAAQENPESVSWSAVA